MAQLPDVEVVTDPGADDPITSPRRCYLECLARTPHDATHRVIIQDDAILAASFLPKLHAAILEHPEHLVVLFMPGASPHAREVILARQRGDSWCRVVPAWVPTVALCWPTGLASAFHAWESSKTSTVARPRRGDDGPVGSWVQRSRVQVWALVPSIVEHPDVEPSLIGRKHAAGRNKARVAQWFDPT